MKQGTASVAEPWNVYRKRGIPAAKRRGIAAQLREYIWPSMGIKAFSRWLVLKLMRQANRPHYVALGVALGIMVGFFPVLGTHTILIAGLCLLFRASFIAGMVGSMVANPWSIGPMWAASFHLGRRMLGMAPASDKILEHMNNLSWMDLWGRFFGLVQHVIFPTIVGGAVLGGPLAVVTYVFVYWWLSARRGKAVA